MYVVDLERHNDGESGLVGPFPDRQAAEGYVASIDDDFTREYATVRPIGQPTRDGDSIASLPKLTVLVDGEVRFDAEVERLKLTQHTPKTVDGCARMELTAVLPPAEPPDHVDGATGTIFYGPI